MIRVALFDFDKTLIEVNSGHLWLRSELKAGRVSARDAAWAVYWFTKYHLGYGDGLDQAFARAVATYARTPDAELAERSQRFFAEQLRLRLRPGARAAITAHREAGHRLAIASSTTQYIADEAMRVWGLELAACTHIAVQDGVVTGDIERSALGRHKTTRVLEWARAEGIDLQEAVFYTDSATDLDLLARVGEPVAVNPDRRLRAVARARRWRIVDWGRGGRSG
jgi:HAD superfamily hydrolase (TIGR01490 family)